MGDVAEMIESGENDCNEEMKEDIESLKSEITMLKSKLNQVDIFKAKAIHSFQLKMLAQFFETGDDHMSEHFYCQGERSRRMHSGFIMKLFSTVSFVTGLLQALV